MKTHQDTVMSKPCQQGSILPVSLVFLLMLTMLGVAGATKSTSDTKMAASFELRAWVFQKANSAVSSTMSDENTWPSAMQGNSAYCQTLNDLETKDQSVISSGTQYEGAYSAPGFSISSNVPCCSNHQFRVQGNATKGTGAAQIDQGVVLLGPKNIHTTPSIKSILGADQIAMVCHEE